MNYHDRTELKNRYIPRHSQRVAWGSATRSSKGQALPHENSKMQGQPCRVRGTKVQVDPPIGRILQRYYDSHHSF